MAMEGSRQTIVVCRCEGEVPARGDFPGREMDGFTRGRCILDQDWIRLNPDSVTRDKSQFLPVNRSVATTLRAGTTWVPVF